MENIDWTFVVIMALPVYFCWAIVHELSHVAVALVVGDLEDWEIKPWPHVDPELGFVWAAVKYRFSRYPSPRGWALIALAPRVMDLVAAALLPLAYAVPGWLLALWLVVWGGGVVDLAVGSIGWSPMSDLRAAELWLDVNPWWLRVPGLLTVATSVALALYLL